MSLGKPLQHLLDEFKVIDALSPELRALVHEYGWRTVKSARKITNSDDPERIRKLCEKERTLQQQRLFTGAENFNVGRMAEGLMRVITGKSR